MDLALWDIKGKALKLPVHELLGGSVRNSLRVLRHHRAVRACGDAAASRPTLRDRARAAMEAGYRAFRMGAGDMPIGGVYNTRERRAAASSQECQEVREGVGPNGDWCIDFHQRFDYNDARPRLPC